MPQPNPRLVSHAYNASAAHRHPREQEADIFRHASAALRHGRRQGGRAGVRAIADNSLLWISVIDLLRDPQNALPDGLRASMISLGLAVQRDMELESPDWDFLISVNDNIAAGLAGQP